MIYCSTVCVTSGNNFASRCCLISGMYETINARTLLKWSSEPVIQNEMHLKKQLPSGITSLHWTGFPSSVTFCSICLICNGKSKLWAFCSCQTWSIVEKIKGSALVSWLIIIISLLPSLFLSSKWSLPFWGLKPYGPELPLPDSTCNSAMSDFSFIFVSCIKVFDSSFTFLSEISPQLFRLTFLAICFFQYLFRGIFNKIDFNITYLQYLFNQFKDLNVLNPLLFTNKYPSDSKNKISLPDYIGLPYNTFNRYQPLCNSL